MKRLFIIWLLALSTIVQAREIIPLNESWLFFYRSENTSDNARIVTLPHSWNTVPAAGLPVYETTGNYQRVLHVPECWASKRLFLKFYGAQSVADLFVNGRYIGTHQGAATAFTFEITDKVRFGHDNTLFVCVSNSYRNDVLPTSTSQNRYGGLYREVELIVTEPTAISPLYFGSEGVLVHPRLVTDDKVEGTVEVHLTAQENVNNYLTLEILDSSGRRVFTKRQRVRIENKPISFPFAINRPQLWNPAQPVLYTVTAMLGESEPIDRVSVRTGFRSIGTEQQGALTINNQPIRLNGVTLYHDTAYTGGLRTAEQLDADLRQIADMGANALRSAVQPHPQHLYNRCDEQGMLVWIDMPLHRAFLSDIAYFATPAFEQNGIVQLQEIIAQNINHPSVVMWGLFSRLRMNGDNPTSYIRKLHNTARTMDPSRPTVAHSNRNGALNFISELIVWKQELGWQRGSADDLTIWRDRLRQDWSHLRSGISYGGNGMVGHAVASEQSLPEANRMPEDRQTRFHEEYVRNLQNDSLFWGVWVENMFDYGSSRRMYGVDCQGLVTFDRRTCKDAYYLYRALWNHRSPTLHLVGKRYLSQNGRRQVLRVYSSSGVPQMTIGADTVAMTEYAPCQYRTDSIDLPDRAEVRIVAGTLRDGFTFPAGFAPAQPKPQGLLQTANPQSKD